jgi:hypothetical protein
MAASATSEDPPVLSLSTLLTALKVTVAALVFMRFYKLGQAVKRARGGRRAKAAAHAAAQAPAEAKKAD